MKINKSWRQVINKFNNKDRIDTFKTNEYTPNINTRYISRGELQKSKQMIINVLKTKPCKTLNEFTHINLSNPWETEYLQHFIKSNVQKFVDDIIGDKIKYFGNIALSCPCGSGKTLAGISLISKLNIQTLIISTRSAINDQWRKTLLNIYKDNILIQTSDGYFTYSNESKTYLKINDKVFNKMNKPVDVYIFSPQYLTYNNEINKRWPKSVGLVIYDEIHSQLSTEYGMVLLQPYNNVINNITTELPCLLGLSATYPINGDHFDFITKIFGTVITNTSPITKTPIYYYDLHDEYHKEHKDEFDNNYSPLDNYEFIDNIINGEYSYYNEHIEPTIKNESILCGFVITSTIKSSVYAWLMFYKKYPNKRCILIREGGTGCYKLIDKPPDDIYNMGPLVDLSDINKHPDFNKFCIKLDDYIDGDILVGTYHRLKEGISVENAVWGICTQFLWSVATRVQLLGRIRRMTKEDYINSYPRYFLTMSTKIPTNKGKILAWKKYHKGKSPEKLQIEYDIKAETTLFNNENYIKISP